MVVKIGSWIQIRNLYNREYKQNPVSHFKLAAILTITNRKVLGINLEGGGLNN
jgi:hypothetical protein